jgi:hypothetical protein
MELVLQVLASSIFIACERMRVCDLIVWMMNKCSILRKVRRKRVRT